jgi:hypothetical protein
VTVVLTYRLVAWSLGVLHHAGESRLPQQMTAGPEPFLKALAPEREALVVGVEGLFNWDLAG